MPLVLSPAGAQYTSVTGTSQKFTNAMAVGSIHQFSCNVDCWVATGATGGAAVADTAANTLYRAGQVLFLTGPHYSPTTPSATTTTSAFVHVICEGSTSGKATLTPLVNVPG